MKKTFKKLIKTADKSRRENGLSNKGLNKILINPKNATEYVNETRWFSKMALDLCKAVDLIIRSNDEIPENLDRKCFELTSLRLRDFAEFNIQFATRMMMSLGVKDEEEKAMLLFDELETIASSNSDGSKPVVTHHDASEHKKYIASFKIFEKHGAYEGKRGVEIAKFIAVVCHHAETLYGGNSNDN